MVKIWDVATGAEIATLRDPMDAGSAHFSPSGKTIVCSGPSGITLLESEVPADGYKARRNGKTASEVVDGLYKEHGLYSEVINKLKADETLDEAVRKIALQIANARLWEDGENPVIDGVVDIGEDETEY